jgi:hypothetical protein
MRRTTTDSEHVLFRGKGMRCLTCTKGLIPYFVVMLVVLLFFVILFFGAYWYRAFLFLLLLPIAVLFVLGLRAMTDRDWVRFDDERKCIVRVGGVRIPYRYVRSIQVREAPDHLAVDVNRKWRLAGWRLIWHLPLEEKVRLMDELRRRFPSAVIRETKTKRPSEAFAAAVWLIVTVSCLVGLYLVSVGNFCTLPGIEVTPEKAVWEPMGKVEGREYRLNAFSFFLPDSFERSSGGEDWLVLRQRHGSVKINVVYDSDISIPRRDYLVRCLFGLKDEYDAYAAVYNARSGVVPLLLKSLPPCGFYALRVYEVETDGLKGFVVRSPRDRLWRARIVLFDREKEAGIRFTFSSAQPVGLVTLVAITTSVRRVPHTARS